MYYRSHDNGTYYVKSGSFGDPILELEIKTNDLEYELKQINNIKYELVEDKILQRNIVNKIIGSYSDFRPYNF